MKNKSSIIIIFTLIIIGLILFLSLKDRNSNIAQIQNIQKNVELIDSEKNYEVKTLNNEQIQGNQMTDGGAQLTGYFKQGKIVKIKEKLSLSYGVKNYEYYFSDGKLIFVYEKDENFPDPENSGTLDYSKTETAFEGYYYFENGKLISKKTIGTKRFSENDIIDIEESFLKVSQENLLLLTQ